MLIVGLGNPGPRYQHSRHNVGFMVLDHLATRFGLRWMRRPLPGLQAEGEHRGRLFVLLKPLTYMNLSGKAVALSVRRFSLEPEWICVVHDDLDLPPGRLRLRHGRGSGGHRGVESVAQELGTSDFLRLRMGIGRPLPGIDPTGYVLEPFEAGDEEWLEPALDRAVSAIISLLQDGPEETMNRFNG